MKPLKSIVVVLLALSAAATAAEELARDGGFRGDVVGAGAAGADAGAGGAAVTAEGDGDAGGGGGAASARGRQAREGVNPPTMATLDCRSVEKGEGRDKILNIAYWQDNVGDFEAVKDNPIAKLGPPKKFVTFAPDRAGWNNCRMTLETVFFFALHTGRTVVMPPSLTMDHFKSGRFQLFYPTEELERRVRIITVEEYVKEILHFPELKQLPKDRLSKLSMNLSSGKVHVQGFLQQVAALNPTGMGVPGIKPSKNGLLMPKDSGVTHSDDDLQDPSLVDPWVPSWMHKREPRHYDTSMQQAAAIHFPNSDQSVRLLTHYYTFVANTDRKRNNLMLRTMRDTLHYDDKLFCKASQIISLLKEDAADGSFSTFHVRRGDFLKAMKMAVKSGEKFFSMSKKYLNEGELIYIATDEKNSSYFDPFRERYTLRFLGDYFERAGLSEVDPDHISFIDSIVAAHGRTFTGTYWSTFSSYIMRMRGFYNYPPESSWYFEVNNQKRMHSFEWPEPPFWFQEWRFGWEDIDEVPPEPARSAYALT